MDHLFKKNYFYSKMTMDILPHYLNLNGKTMTPIDEQLRPN